MSLQGFTHFLKVMRLAATRDEALRAYEALHELVRLPLQDTLNIKNGINYAMFLEAIIRIAYHRLEEAGIDQDYKSVLEQMFNEGNIELKKRMMDERLLSELYSHDNAKVFYEHSTLLSAVFSAKARLNQENFLEMSKEEYMQFLTESGILTDRKEEEPATGEIKRKFNGETIMASIASVGSFDTNYLTYVDFLDCLVRTASLYPFPDSGPQKAQFAAMDSRLQYLIS